MRQNDLSSFCSRVSLVQINFIFSTVCEECEGTRSTWGWKPTFSRTRASKMKAQTHGKGWGLSDLICYSRIETCEPVIDTSCCSKLYVMHLPHLQGKQKKETFYTALTRMPMMHCSKVSGRITGCKYSTVCTSTVSISVCKHSCMHNVCPYSRCVTSGLLLHGACMCIHLETYLSAQHVFIKLQLVPAFSWRSLFVWER